jgi:hypothetical protein
MLPEFLVLSVLSLPKVPVDPASELLNIEELPLGLVDSDTRYNESSNVSNV